MKQNQLKMAAALGAEAVMVFENLEFGKIRIIADNDGEPLFCGKGVCDALGYRRVDFAVHQHVTSSDVVKRCVAKTVKNRYGVCEGKVQMLLVTESGFYVLGLGSKFHSSRRFKQWVTAVPSYKTNKGRLTHQ